MAAKKTTTKKTKPAARTTSNNAASRKVERAMHEMKEGTLRSGGSKKKVTSRKQAIAIGLSEARRAGANDRRDEGRVEVRGEGVRELARRDRPFVGDRAALAQ